MAFWQFPYGSEATAAGFGEPLSAHARIGSVSDFLPDVLGINGGSPHPAHASDMIDQTSAAGVRFASFGGLAREHAPQTLSHANGTSLGVGYGWKARLATSRRRLCHQRSWGGRRFYVGSQCPSAEHLSRAIARTLPEQ